MRIQYIIYNIANKYYSTYVISLEWTSSQEWTVSSEAFGESKLYVGFSAAQHRMGEGSRVSAPNPYVVQGSPVLF